MSSQPSIVVIGSANVDMVARADHLPKPGETVMGESFTTVAGGKGANQAVAAARLGARVTFVGRVGDDAFGRSTIDGMRAEGIDTTYLTVDPEASTGVALIGVSSTSGENSIIVVPGANGRVSVADVDAAAEVIRAADMVVAQFEVPLLTIKRAFEIARKAKVRTLLNPAPARKVTPAFLKLVSIMVPNEHEAAALMGHEAADHRDAVDWLRAQGISSVVVTLGKEGAYVHHGNVQRQIPGVKVGRTVDTTAAGDCFIGALAVAMCQPRGTDDAVVFANTAAGISVTRAGAQPSLPTLAEVDAFTNGS